ncbi:fumarylacetoacetate hydrolase family protein [Citricoccus sp. NR2]|uniref:fumarylacetoacetate hydrolase family protein n=1 Tax=Citricoccus sp. NR2 TaxID=3004095 RepID=UPI0022DE85B2|nr:fumarylacetoacetate hydrolase family protein [Citricoccus sp. NR2]WBL19143.1 fumarylacetoacetate hydrolase family protein [Citricoccus sp. NR2]
MKLATFRQPDAATDQPGATFAALITSVETHDGVETATAAVALPEVQDVGEFLAYPTEEREAIVAAALEQAEEQPASVLDPAELTYDTLVPFPTKVFCVGLNYLNHIEETGQQRPEYPSLFAKFGQSLTAAGAEIEIPAEDHRLDYEGELCIVIGEPGRRIAEADAADHIAGYAIANDVSLRGFQGRTTEWLQGKIFEATTPVGPWLVTADEFDGTGTISTFVNGERVQYDDVADQVFSPAQLVSYISTMITLLPGDLILTGTPAGVALGRRNDEGRHPWLRSGDVVEVRIEGLGAQRNTIA